MLEYTRQDSVYAIVLTQLLTHWLPCDDLAVKVAMGAVHSFMKDLRDKIESTPRQQWSKDGKSVLIFKDTNTQGLGSSRRGLCRKGGRRRGAAERRGYSRRAR